MGLLLGQMDHNYDGITKNQVDALLDGQSLIVSCNTKEYVNVLVTF